MSSTSFQSLTVAQLRTLLKAENLDFTGRKAELIQRLEEATTEAATNEEPEAVEMASTAETETNTKRPAAEIEEQPKKRVATDAGEVVFKFTVSNNDAGSIIGKGGETINEIKSTSGAEVRLSQNKEFFPNTEERVVMAQGTAEQVKTAYALVVARRFEVFLQGSKSGVPLPEPQSMKVLIPAAASGVVIGKGGENIQRVMREANAHVQLANKEDRVAGVKERMVTIAGSKEAQVTAGQLILDLMLESDEGARTYENMSTNYTPRNAPQYSPYGAPAYQYGVRPAAPVGYASAYASPKPAPVAYSPRAAATGDTSVTMQCPDTLVGAIVGKGGAVINEMKRMSGAQIQISQKGEYVPGTTDRSITITGTNQACQMAKKLIEERLAGANARATGAPTPAPQYAPQSYAPPAYAAYGAPAAAAQYAPSPYAQQQPPAYGTAAYSAQQPPAYGGATYGAAPYSGAR